MPRQEGKYGTGLIDISLVVPAVVKHGFRKPLVRIVLHKIIQKSHSGVWWNSRSALKLALEAADQGVESTAASSAPSAPGR